MSKKKVKKRAKYSKNQRNLPINRIKQQKLNKKNVIKKEKKINKSPKHAKESPKEKSKKIKNSKINIKKILLILLTIIIFISIVVGIIWYLLNYVFIAKEVLQIEVGTRTEINPKEFLKNENMDGEVKILTDISNIDYNKIATYNIEFEFKNRQYKSKLQFVDTTPPTVEFQNVNAYIDYVFNADDFIVSKNDITQMTVEIQNQPEITEFKEYPITIIVKDEGGNVTKGNVSLNTSYIKNEFTLELGTKLTHEDLLTNPTLDRDVLSQSELDRINSSPVGDYEIKTSNKGTEITTKIKIQDITAPSLTLKDVTIYNDQESLGKEAFIASVSDFSECSTELKTALPLKQLGTFDIQIEAKDIYGNAVTQTAKLNIIKDTTGPVISGLGNLSVAKNANVDWNKGVTARDDKDGTCTFTVDTSGVNISAAGTYTVTYTSKDKSGNTTRKTRKITVNPDANDVYAKASEWLSASGTSPVAIKNYVSNKIKYSTSTNHSTIWGAWMGFTTLRGDCYVHTAVTNMLLQKAGYSCMIVNATDNSHYWNLVNVGGVWRHLDSTPPTYSQSNLMTDAERYSTLRGKDWNRDAFPKAE